MIEPTPTPSPLLRTGAFLARWALRLLVLAWASLVLAWGALHAVIVPRIGEWRPWLEARASDALGHPVRIGQIVARSTGLIPALELQNVQLFDAAGHIGLELARVQVAVSPRSLMGLGFEQLHVQGPTLEIRRTADGQVWVAGLALQNQATDDFTVLDWVFSQPELAILDGTLRWVDELRGTAPLELTTVDVVVRNRLLTHSLRVDATPPAAWGSRMTLMGRFSEPLLARHGGNWRAWKGQVYATVAQVDLSPLRPYAAWDWELAQGVGAVRAWLDVEEAEVRGATLDVALRNLQLRWNQDLEPLRLPWVAGRLGVAQRAGNQELFTRGLEFEMADGLRWPGGNVRVARTQARGDKPAQGSASADRLDLAALSRIATRLPLDAALRAQLEAYAPQGVVESLEAQWQGPLEQPQNFSAQGRVSGLALAPRPHDALGTPGIAGADVSFEVGPQGGKAHVSVHNGAVQTPGVFDDPVIALDRLQADVSWKQVQERVQVQVRSLEFANADAQGGLEADWQTGQGADRFPGTLDLRGTLSRAAGNRVYRYIPKVVDPEVRAYLQAAIQAGQASNVKFKVKGALQHFPYLDPKQGEFRISADVQQADYDYAPPLILPPNSPPWPGLRGLSCALLIDRGALTLRGIRSGIEGLPGLQIGKADATIVDLYARPVLQVHAEGKVPLNEGLGFLKTSPLGPMTGNFLGQAHGTGSADFRFRLGVPLVGAVPPQVQGSVTLSGNDVSLTPDIPYLTRVRGVVGFTESGFTVTGAQARALGGDVRVEGGLQGLGNSSTTAAKGAPTVLRASGVASAEGLRQARELGWVSRLAQYASGATPYSVQVGLRQGVPELLIQSSLVGVAVSLPAPLSKMAEQALPLRFETRAVPGSSANAPVLEQLQVDVDKVASVTYVRDPSTPQPTVLRGALGLGLAADESAPMPAQGVVANVQFGALDLDAWGEALARIAGSEGSSASARTAQAASALEGYLPHSLAVRAKALQWDGRTVHNVVVGGVREGALWRANVDAAELSGYLEYRQPGAGSAGRMYARLARLAVAQSDAQDVENLLDSQPASIPALDIVVEDFELRGRKLGRLDIDAVNLGAAGPREWRLNRFNLAMPEAMLTAYGNWAALASSSAAAAPARSVKERRRTVMNFKLDIADAGELLGRFGMKDVLRKGQGKLEGQIAWQGSPLTLDYASMGGGANLNLENGQFLKADPGLAKLLGVLSLQSLPRRLTLDFRDVFSEGFAFDFVRGDVTVAQGIARTNNLQMKGVNAAVLMEGQADIEKETQSLKVVVVPEINAGSASLIASVINPVVGLTTFLAQWMLRRPLAEATTQEFLIDGTWTDPRVTRVSGRGAAENDKKFPNPKEPTQ